MADNIFLTSAYYLLGLPVSAEQGEIKKKARLITAQLSIGENALDNDVAIIPVNRTEDSIRDSVQRLSSPIRKAQEVYLWFSDENSDELIKTLGEGYLEEAYKHLSQRSKLGGKWNAKRDLAIYLCQLMCAKKGEKGHLSESLELWKDLLSSESAWRYFDLYYKNIDDLHTDDSALVELRKWADQAVSDLYSHLSEKWDDQEYAQAYTKTFGKIGTHTHKKVLAPRTRDINGAVEALGAITWQEKSPSKENMGVIKKGIGDIQDALNILMEAGLYEERDVVALRDKASDAIRSVAVDLTNKYEDFERSASLMAIAEEISGTQGTKARNQSDRATVEGNRAAQKFFVPALELINKGKYLQAVDYVAHQLDLNKDDPAAHKMLDEQLTLVMGRYITETRSLAMDKINKNDFSGAIRIFEKLRKYIYDNLDRFSLVKEKVDEMVEDIDNRSATVNKTVFDVLLKERDDAVKNINQSLGENSSANTLLCLLDCAYYVPAAHFLDMNMGKNQALSILFRIGWWTVLIYGMGLIFLIPAYIWQNMEVRYVRA